METQKNNFKKLILLRQNIRKKPSDQENGEIVGWKYEIFER